MNGLGYIERVFTHLDRTHPKPAIFFENWYFGHLHMIWVGRMNTLYIDHNTVKCQYHKCLGLRNHFLSWKKSEIQPRCLSWTQTAALMSHIIRLIDIVTRWIGLLRLLTIISWILKKVFAINYVQKLAKKVHIAHHAMVSVFLFPSFPLLWIDLIFKNSAMNIELWCLRKLFNNEFFWSWLTKTNNKKQNSIFSFGSSNRNFRFGTRSDPKKNWDINHVT